MLQYTVSPVSDNKFLLSLEIEREMIKPLVSAFGALFDLSQSVLRKSTLTPSYKNMDKIKIEGEQYCKDFNKTLTALFTEIYKKSNDVTFSIKETNRRIKLIYPNTCFDMVRTQLSKLGLLKNKNYNYKKTLDIK